MGAGWDYDVPTVEVWREVWRVLKPGGHLLAFAGTRTQHRMAVNIEDAGFEIRDMIAWVYGSGFPKSLDVSKAIDKAAGKLSAQSVGFNVAGKSSGLGTIQRKELRRDHPDYKAYCPATDAAKQWAGWGTALKPALEPITVARKPLIGTVAENVLRHGTGAINVDGCRVGTDDGQDRSRPPRTPNAILGGGKGTNLTASEHNAQGRWPANLIHDGNDEVVGLFPQTTAPQPRTTKRSPDAGRRTGYGTFNGQEEVVIGYGDSGSAARFFYTAKAAKSERQGVTHPTVKPLDLMAYLCRLVTPPGGIVLDPFMGTGTTIIAALSEGFHGIGIERDPAYFAMAEHRLNGAQLGLGLELPT